MYIFTVYGSALMCILSEMQRHFVGRFMWLEKADDVKASTVIFTWISKTPASLQLTNETKDSKMKGLSFAFKVACYLHMYSVHN